MSAGRFDRDEVVGLLGDAAGDALEVPLVAVAEALVAIAELRGYGWANPDPRQSRYVLDRCDTIARALGLEDWMKRLSADAMEGA